MYGTIDDMMTRFGRIEMIRLSVADGDVPDDIIPGRIEGALRDATDLIDSYLRTRYRVPVSPVPLAIVRAACILARFDLAHGSAPEPSEQATKAREEIITWLKRLADGTATLDDGSITTGDSSSGAKVSDRPPMFSDRNLRGW